MHERLYDKLESVLDDMERKDKLSASDIQIIDWVTHAQKSMLCKEEKNGYSGNSYRRRDSMGRFSGDPYSRNYSRNGKEEYIDHMRSMMDNAPDERTRQSMQRMIREIEQD